MSILGILKKRISVISPVYMAENIVDELVNRLETELEKISDDYEIILVEDGSPDNSWEKIEDICKINPKVKGIKLSRNFGQHYAITAGLDHATGEWIVVMDCDLQDQPEEIINLYNKTKEGYSIVLARREFRKDGFTKKMFSKLFYSVLGYLTGVKQDETIANFGIYHTRVIEQIKKSRESIRYFPTMVTWVGFKSTKINVKHSERSHGTSSYNFKKLLTLALDIMLAYSDKPIRLTIKFGFIIAFTSFMFAIAVIIQWLTGNIEVLGYSSLIISVWFLSGCILITLGVVGLYIGKTFEGVKGRPVYIIENSIHI